MEVVGFLETDGDQGQSKRWCFTWNNPGEERPVYDAATMDYCCWEKETGASGTPHWQGYIRFKARKRFAAVKRVLPQAHIAIARGTEEQNRTYCSKDQTDFEEHGEYTKDAGQQGKRSDLVEIGAKLVAGTSLKDIALQHPSDMIRYSSGILKYQQIVRPPPPPVRNVHTIVLWGESGVGKSHRCHVCYPDLYPVSTGRSPWDSYSGQNTILFDEFNPENWPLTELNRYLDKWPLELNCRYANKMAEWELVLICSNLNPDLWYLWPGVASQKAALQRRLSAPVGIVVEVLSQEMEIPGFEMPHPMILIDNDDEI